MPAVVTAKRLPLVRRQSLRAQVTEKLRADIVAGKFESGQLPSIRQLAGRFNCSTMVISGALDALQAEGLIRRRRGKGVFVAEGLKTKAIAPAPVRTGNIALFSRTGHAAIMEDTYYAEVWAGMLQAAAGGGHRLTAVHLAGRSAHDVAMRTAEEIPLDGCIILGIADQQVVLEIVDVGLPTVVADHNFGAEGIGVDCIDLDSESGSLAAVRHLVELGHDRIGFVDSRRPEHNPDRKHGYLKGMEEAGLEVEERYQFSGTPNLEGGHKLMCAALDAGRELPTALVFNGSTVAVGAMHALAERGHEVPGDVSLVACGGRWFTNMYPDMTLAASDAHLLGVEAVRALLRRVDEPARPVANTMIPMELVVRGSTAAPRAERNG